MNMMLMMVLEKKMVNATVNVATVMNNMMMMRRRMMTITRTVMVMVLVMKMPSLSTILAIIVMLSAHCMLVIDARPSVQELVQKYEASSCFVHTGIHTRGSNTSEIPLVESACITIVGPESWEF